MRKFTIKDVQEAVSAEYGIHQRDIFGGWRAHHVTYPKWVGLWIMKRYCGLSGANIAHRVGMDHTSMIYALAKVDAILEADGPSMRFTKKYRCGSFPRMRTMLARIIARIEGPPKDGAAVMAALGLPS